MEEHYYPPTEAEITAARKEGDKKIANLTGGELKALRIKAKFDLFFLTYGILGYDKLSINLHGDFCRWIEAHRAYQYTLKLLPRSHYKSTCDTIAESIQCALPDDSGAAIYPYNLGTNVRQLLAHDIAEMAQKFLRSITQHFTVNPYLVGLFPECVPDPKKHKINIKELELPRSAVWNESTFDTMGVGARGQGNHYNRIKLDDIYGEAARDSKADRESHIQWFDNIQSFLITPLTDQVGVVGTRWAFDDVYAHAMKVYGTNLKTYVRSVYEKNKDGVLVPIFPEQFSIPSLEILKKNKKVWNAQYINNPSEGSASFQSEWKRFYKQIGRNLIVEVKSNPFNDGEIRDINYEELDIVILVDPAMDNGLTGIAVTGMDKHEDVFVLEAIKNTFKPEELCNKIFSLVVKYQPRVVAIEDVLFSALFEVWFRTEMNVRGIRFRIVGVRTKQQEKAVRVSALSNWYSAGKIYFKEDQIELIEEFDQFGATDDYHIHDALAYGPRLDNDGNRVWRRGGGIRNIKKDNILNSPTSNRDHITGYSKIRGIRG